MSAQSPHTHKGLFPEGRFVFWRRITSRP